MKNITITIDLKSLCLGAVGVLCVGLLSNFNNAGQPGNNTADEVRRYQAVSGPSGTILLDTKTGQYLIDRSVIGQPRWVKGDFTTAYRSTARTN